MKSSIIFCLVLMSFSLVAQQVEEVTFSESVFDFGTIREENGPVIHEFTFTNNGIDTMKVVAVKASCGCTTPAWTREPVAPGETGIVQAQYNPRNRPGVFNKSLTITTTKGKSPYKLYIKGNVVPKALTIDEELRTELGGLRMKYRSINVGKVKTKDQPEVKSFDVYNQSKEDIVFNEKVLAPSHIKVSFEPSTLGPQTRGKLMVTYDAKSKNDLGFMNDNVTFYTNEAGEDSIKSISVYATIEEYFPPMTKEEFDNAPKLKITEASYDFGKIKPGQKVSTEFVLVNNGRSDLNIRKTKGNCSCTVAKLEKQDLKPGESVNLKVTFDSKNRKGNQQKSVTIYTNDPKAPAQRVTVKAYVETAGL